MALNDKVIFKIGTQSNLNTMLNSGTGHQVGTFYLTSDTDRLYVGQASGLKLLNKAVMTVSSMDDLTALTTSWGSNKAVHKDDIAYVSGANVLAYFNGTTWNQINPDTYSVIDTFAQTVGAATDGAKVTTALTQTKGDSKSAAFTIVGDKGVKVVNNGASEIKVTGDTYTLSSSVANGVGTVKLESALGQDDSSFTITGGTNITIDADTTGGLKITANDTVLTGNALSIDKNGKLTSAVSDSKGTKSAQVTLGYTVGGQFLGIGGADTANAVELPVYTKTEIENKFKDLNGLTYRGTIGTSGTYEFGAGYMVDGEKVHNGDMFLVSGEATYASGKTAKTGDLLIATGTENDSGVLESITWTFVPSGDDTAIDTQYTWLVDATTKKMVVSANPGGTKSTFQLNAGTATDITVETNSSNDLYNATIKHANVECEKSNTNSTLSQDNANFIIDAVSAINVNEQGHVDSVTTTKYSLVKYQGAAPAIATTTGGLKFSSAITANGTVAYNTNSAFELKSDTLKLSYDSGVVTADLLWGEF